jgi:phage shock protein E
MNFILKYKLTILGVVAGAIAGYVYYCTVGCVTGSCAITSQPINSTLYGAVLGGLALNLFQKDEKKTKV